MKFLPQSFLSELLCVERSVSHVIAEKAAVPILLQGRLQQQALLSNHTSQISSFPSNFDKPA